jgi:hypothetical protein
VRERKRAVRVGLNESALHEGSGDRREVEVLFQLQYENGRQLRTDELSLPLKIRCISTPHVGMRVHVDNSEGRHDRESLG